MFGTEEFAAESISLPAHNCVARLVDSVNKIDKTTKEEILRKLVNGRIVVSKDPKESAVESLTPLWDSEGSMIILGIQVKVLRSPLHTRATHQYPCDVSNQTCMKCLGSSHLRHLMLSQVKHQQKGRSFEYLDGLINKNCVPYFRSTGSCHFYTPRMQPKSKSLQWKVSISVWKGGKDS